MQVKTIAVILGAIVMASCASFSPQSREDILMQRAGDRWQALLERNVSKAYDWISPGQKAVESRELYISRFGNKLTYLKATPTKVTCESDERCTVIVNVESRVPVPGFINTPIKSDVIETWIMEDGAWWYFRQ